MSTEDIASETEARKAIDKTRLTTSGIDEALSLQSLSVFRWFFNKYNVDNKDVGQLYRLAKVNENWDVVKWLDSEYEIIIVFESPKNLRKSCYGSFMIGQGTTTISVRKKIFLKSIEEL